ncbi:hypothetical protein BB560_002890 [Smittium megazygosporum]|uniref:Uncharacterized protein n=1 Tax=Smittium megazygosporum TaxID=133381 RepID=A0A2T9ZDH7_9FUNG|nr:hypothetical protein BB560_002890 [Smittium megazygosporum]
MNANTSTGQIQDLKELEDSVKSAEQKWLLHSLFVEKIRKITLLLKKIINSFDKPDSWEKIEFTAPNGMEYERGSAIFSGSKLRNLELEIRNSLSRVNEHVNISFAPDKVYTFNQFDNLILMVKGIVNQIENVSHFPTPIYAIRFIEILRVKLKDIAVLFFESESSDLRPITEIQPSFFSAELKKYRVVDMSLLGDSLFVNIFNIQSNANQIINGIFGALASSTSGNTILYNNQICQVRYETNFVAKLGILQETIALIESATFICETMLSQIMYLI